MEKKKKKQSRTNKPTSQARKPATDNRQEAAGKSKRRKQSSGSSPKAKRKQGSVEAKSPKAPKVASSTRRSAPKSSSGRSKATKKTSTAKKSETPASKFQREMLINVSKGEECRIAVLEKGKLEEIYFERQSSESYVGNIYKGVVTNVEPSIQAAFIDFGVGKNGFLHISDLQPQYFPKKKREVENIGRKISRRDRPPIQDCLKRNNEVIVQVIKEGIGSKGPTLTTYLSMPGRYLVMMPGMNKLGVSRRIEDSVERQDMREILKQLPLPSDMGFILRTAGLGCSKRDLQRDLNYLNRLWKSIVKRVKKEKAPAALYQESDLVVRTVRDVLKSDLDRIVIDDRNTADRAKDFLAIAMPRSGGLIEYYSGKLPLFHKYDIEKEVEKIYLKHVPLPSGGSLVIEPTEALVAIDVNIQHE